MRWFVLAAVVGAVGIAAITATTAGATDEVNLYSYRQPFLINPILEEFTRRTGIKVNVVYAKQGMLEKIKAEGRNSPADAVLTVDIGRLHDMVKAGVLQPVQSAVLDGNVPTQYQHPKKYWYGMTTRARVLLVSKERVEAAEITTYEDLTDPIMKGRICIRSGKHDYNVSLIASIIADKGEEATKNWLQGVRDNLARRPQGNDRAQAKAIFEGVCDVAVANTYYMGKMATNDKQPEQKEWAAAIRIVFPNTNGRGTHINISGAAVTKHAPNMNNAVKLLEFLSGNYAQKAYAEKNFEYPVKAGVPLHPLVASWGAITADTKNLAKIAKLRGIAAKLVDEVGFDLGSGP
jgi:iron(III) transport system substrate-binding protein